MELDPYSDATEYIFKDYVPPDVIDHDLQCGGDSNKEELHLVLAIQHYREKAEFYRTQKNRTAQRACTMKKELDRTTERTQMRN